MKTESPKIHIGEHGWVKLYDHYPNQLDSADMEIVAAARTSYAGDMKGPEKDLKLLEYLIQHRHDSPLEMVDVEFTVKAPLVVWWQWTRHRTFSYNFQSGRYTPFDENETLVPLPEEWRKQDHKNRQGSDGYVDVKMGQFFTQHLADLHNECFRLYEELLDAGVAREQARLCLPGFAVFYQARVKANLRNWLHFITLRTDPHAQLEIRRYARVIKQQLTTIAPYTIKFYEQHRKSQ